MDANLLKLYTTTDVHCTPEEFLASLRDYAPPGVKRPEWLHIPTQELFHDVAIWFMNKSAQSPLRRFVYNRMSDPKDYDFEENCQLIMDYTCMRVAFGTPGTEEIILKEMPERCARFLMGKYLVEFPELASTMPSSMNARMNENIAEYEDTRAAIEEFIESDKEQFRTVQWLLEQGSLGREDYTQKPKLTPLDRPQEYTRSPQQIKRDDEMARSSTIKRKEPDMYERYDNRPQNLSRDELEYRRRRDAEDRRRWDEERNRDRGFDPDTRYRDTGRGHPRDDRGYRDDRYHDPRGYDDRGRFDPRYDDPRFDPRYDDRGYPRDDRDYRGGYRDDPRRAAYEEDMRRQQEFHRNVSLPPSVRNANPVGGTESRYERQMREAREAAAARGGNEERQEPRQDPRPAQQFSASQMRNGGREDYREEQQAAPAKREYMGGVDVTNMDTNQREALFYAQEAERLKAEKAGVTVVRKEAPAPEERPNVSTFKKQENVRPLTIERSNKTPEERKAEVMAEAKARVQERGQAEEVWFPEEHSEIIATSGANNFFRRAGKEMQEMGDVAAKVVFQREEAAPPAPPPERQPTTPPPAPPEAVPAERAFFIELKPHRTTLVRGKQPTLEDQKKPGRLYDVVTLEEYRGEDEMDMMQHATVYATEGLPKGNLKGEYARVLTALQALKSDELKYADIAHLVDDNITSMIAENNIESAMRTARLSAMESSLTHEEKAGTPERRFERVLALTLNTNVTFKTCDVLKGALKSAGTMEKLHAVLRTCLRTSTNEGLVDTPEASDIRAAIAFLDRHITEDLNRFLVDVLGVVPVGQRAIDSFVSDYDAMVKALNDKFHTSTYESFLAFSVKYMRAYQEALTIPDMDIDEAAYQLTGASDKMDVIYFPSVNLITVVPFTADELGLPNETFKVTANSATLIRALIIGDATVLKNLTGVEHAYQYILTRDHKAYKVSRDTNDKSVVVLSPVKL